MKILRNFGNVLSLRNRRWNNDATKLAPKIGRCYSLGQRARTAASEPVKQQAVNLGPQTLERFHDKAAEKGVKGVATLIGKCQKRNWRGGGYS